LVAKIDREWGSPAKQLDEDLELFREEVEKLARGAGWFVHSSESSDGFPRLVLLRNGKMLAIHIAEPRAVLTMRQKTWATEFSKMHRVSDGAVRFFLLSPLDQVRIKLVLENRST
jgi:hypothetical protein